MALKKINTQFVKMKGGDEVEGYLVSRGTQEFPSDSNPGGTSLVPTLILQKLDGTKIKVLLGSTLNEDAALLLLNLWTKVVRHKEQGETRKGRKITEFDLLQDTDKVLAKAA